MKKGYWIVAYRSISDEAALKAYSALAGAALEPFSPRVLAGAGSRIETREAGLHQRTTVIEFDSYETAIAAYESELYQKALRVLGASAERDFRILEAR